MWNFARRFCLIGWICAWLFLQSSAKDEQSLHSEVKKSNYSGEHLRAFRFVLIQVPESSGLPPPGPQSGLKRNILTIILRFTLVALRHPSGATWCPKVSKMRALGPQSVSKWSQVCPQGSPGVPKVAPNVQKDHLGKLPGTQVGPKVAQVPFRAPFLSVF